ncbi:MAG: NAD(P)-dependent oxidoreductase [Hyphomicrobiales bacterium]|nr:MAG: NAD(P)-dependent oxidoreductase [Hyphomicrobiales bacterium]
MGVVSGKVAFISGVARGMGRAHAVRLAEEGADIIGFDLCADDPDVEYPLATRADLDETVRLVEGHGRRILVDVLDVRDAPGIQAFLDRSVAELGGLDIVIANAGIASITGEQHTRLSSFEASVDIMLKGVFYTVRAAIPHVQAGGRGGSIVITSSTAGLKGTGDGEPGSMGYVAAKHGVVGLMRSWANVLAKDLIRVNTIHPTGVATPMIVNEAFAKFVQTSPEFTEVLKNPLPTTNGMIEAFDVTDTVLHLVSDAGRYITGVTLPVDAGFNNRV